MTHGQRMVKKGPPLAVRVQCRHSKVGRCDISKTDLYLTKRGSLRNAFVGEPAAPATVGKRRSYSEQCMGKDTRADVFERNVDSIGFVQDERSRHKSGRKSGSRRKTDTPMQPNSAVDRRLAP